MGIKIIKDKDLIYDVKNYDIILVGTSIMNRLSNGFQYKVALNFPGVFNASKTGSKYGDINKLGKMDVVEIPDEPLFALCYITKGRFGIKRDIDALNYDALEKCLNLIKKYYHGLRIASTILGYSAYEGGGDKAKILALFERILDGEDVTLYDYIQKDIREEKREHWKKVIERIGEDDYDYCKRRYFWEWGVGIFKPFPEDKTLAEIKKYVNTLKESRNNIASFIKNA
jgi:hypothetical protein